MPKKKATKKKLAKTSAPAKKKPEKVVYQFKITLMGVKPKVWRRIQIRDCFLEDLHWHVQGAFGWTNSHLHDFDIGSDRYCIPSKLDMEDMPECKDSTKTLLSDLLPKDGRRFVFKYVIRRAKTGHASAPKTGHHVGGIGRKNPLVGTCWQGA